MQLCRHCNAQFPDEYERCLHCQRRLGPEPGAAGAGPAPDLSGLHHLTDDHPAKIAPLLAGLRDAGVVFTLITDGGTRRVDWVQGSSGWKAKASVYVAPADREVAEGLHRAFLERMIPHLGEMAAGGAAPDGACPACHAALSIHAAACPSCGLAFPEAEPSQ